MSIEEQLKRLIRNTYGTSKAFCDSVGMPQPTLSSLLKRGISNANFSSIVTICQALHISVDALAEGEIVQIDEARRPVPALPPHEQSLLDAYRAMSPREQQLVCRMVGIAHPDDTLKKTNRHA